MEKINYTKKVKGFSFSQLARCMSFAFIFGAVSIMALNAQTMPAAQSLPYTQDFASLTGVTPAYPAGWQAWQVAGSAPSSTGRTSVTMSDKAISVGNASSTGSGAYDFNGKIGFMSVGSSDVALCLALNTTGKSNIKMTFDAMTIRNLWDGVSASSGYQNGLVLQYRVGTGTTVFTNLTYSPAEFLTGSAVQTSAVTLGINLTQGLNAFLPATCENQSVVQVRWIYRNVAGGTSGNRPSAAIDNVSVTQVPVTFTSGFPKAENPTASGFTAKSNINTPGTTYFVVLANGASAPSAAQVKTGQDASSTAVAVNEKGLISNIVGSSEYVTAVSGLSGNTTYDVYFIAEGNSGLSLQSTPQKVSVTTTGSAVAPTITHPTATSITSVDVTFGGEITSDGGSTILERGTVWKTSTGVTIDDNKLAEGLSATGVFTHSRTVLPSKTQIFYKAYTLNAIDVSLTEEASFFTKAVEPTLAVGSFTANTISGNYTSVDLSWTAAEGADGYIILKRDGASSPGTAPSDLTNYAVGNSIGTGTVVAIVNSGAATSQVITGLTAGSQYTFRIYPFGYDGTNAATMNYAPIALSVSATATTLVPAPTTYTWNQTGTASWTTTSNWTPTRTTLNPNDILQINGGGSVVLTDVPNQTIAQLSITNNTSVELQSATASTLTIAGEAATDLTLSAGSSLTINQANAIVLALLTGTTAEIAGTMLYGGGAHKLTAVDASTVAFKIGATFTAGTSFSGNAFGTTGNSSVVFESGSSYIFIAGSNPFGATAPASAVVFQAGSNYIHKSTGSPSFSNRTYANFELNEATANISTTSANPLTVGDLTVTSGSLGLGVTAAFNVKGNITVASGSTLNFNPAMAGTLVFSGTNPQTITNNGVFTNNAFSTMSVTNSNPVVFYNSFGATLTAAASLPGILNNSGTFNLSEMSTTLSGTINQVVKDANWSAVITSVSGASLDISALTMTVALDGGYSPVKDDVAILINIPSGTIIGDFSSISLPSSYWTKYSSAGMINAKFDNTTSVSNFQTEQNVSVVNGQLMIFGGDVYNSVGVKVASVIMSNEKTALSLRSGIYIVKSIFGNQKVMIK